jgi:hypothetical protein
MKTDWSRASSHLPFIYLLFSVSLPISFTSYKSGGSRLGVTEHTEQI